MIVDEGRARDDCKTAAEKLCSYEIVEEILDYFNQRNKSQQLFLFASLGPSFGLKIDIKFTETSVIVKGTLQHSNGRPLAIPRNYRDLLVKKINTTNRKNINFQFNHTSQTLTLHCEFKISPHTQEPSLLIKKISSDMKKLTADLELVRNALIVLGIVKINSSRQSKIDYKIHRMACEISEKLQTPPPQPQSDPGPAPQRRAPSAGSVFQFYDEIQPCHWGWQDQNISKQNQSSSKANKQQPAHQIELRLFSLSLDEPYQQMPTTKIMQLAVKKAPQVLHQLGILSNLNKSAFFLTYYLRKKDQNLRSELVMEYISHTLREMLFCEVLELTDRLDIAQQVVQAMMTVHESGVVHRDLKPENILIQKVSKNKYQVKIIDFGEATLISDSIIQQSDMPRGSTPPYSPIECCKACPEGSYSIHIDTWSVGFLIYQLFSNQKPLYYSQCLKNLLYWGWKQEKQYQLILPMRRRHGVRFLEYVHSIIALNTLRINQEERVPLRSILGIVEGMIAHVEALSLD